MTELERWQAAEIERLNLEVEHLRLELSLALARSNVIRARFVEVTHLLREWWDRRSKYRR